MMHYKGQSLNQRTLVALAVIGARRFHRRPHHCRAAVMFFFERHMVQATKTILPRVDFRSQIARYFLRADAADQPRQPFRNSVTTFSAHASSSPELGGAPCAMARRCG